MEKTVTTIDKKPWTDMVEEAKALAKKEGIPRMEALRLIYAKDPEKFKKQSEQIATWKTIDWLRDLLKED